MGIARQIDDRHHRFHLEIETPVPTIRADRDFLEHIFLNLLTNALKYSPENTTITIAVSSDESAWHFSVRDEGIGIPEEDIKDLFEPFQRASNVGSVKGTGLGLAIVKQYIELHGGTIEVQSTEGKGTTVTVQLPFS